MKFAEQDIFQLVESIWSSVLGLEVRRNAGEVTLEARERFLTGAYRSPAIGRGQWFCTARPSCRAWLGQ